MVYENHEEKEYEKFTFTNSNYQFSAIDEKKFTYTHIKNGDKLVTIGNYIVCDKDRLMLYFDSTIQKTHLLPIDRGQFKLTKTQEASNTFVSKISVIDKYSKQPLSFINIDGFQKGNKKLSEQPIDNGQLLLDPPLEIDSLSIFYRNRTIPCQLKIDDNGVFEIDASINSYSSFNKTYSTFHNGVKTEMNVELKDGKIYKVYAPSYKNREYIKQ